MGGGVPGVDSSWRSDICMLMMETQENVASSEHVIDIPRSVDENGLMSDDRTNSSLDDMAEEGRSSSGVRMQGNNWSSSRNSSIGRRGEARQRRSPLNSGLWISVELVLTLSQIVTSIVVLVISGKEKPNAPLRAWIIGYASGSAATLPLLYWRYRHRNQVSEQDSAPSRQGSARINVPAEPFSVSVSRASELDNHRTPGSPARVIQNAGIVNPRVEVLVEYIKMALDCFFAVWFVVGNVWIFGGRSSISTAPNLYRLCIVFLVFTCIGYAMPLILCTTICCCLPCIISILGFREDSAQARGATSESIDALPTYKFKSQRSRNGNDRDNNSGTEGGILAAGTEKERMISREDAVCCICLAKYANNDELRELPCSHFFHKECVDKWLKINASCPLCKCDVGENVVASPPASNPTQQQLVEIPVGTMF